LLLDWPILEIPQCICLWINQLYIFTCSFVFIKYIRVIVFRVPVKCETKHNEIYQNETKLHHVYLWYTLRAKIPAFPPYYFIVTQLNFTNAHRHTCSVHQIANFILPHNEIYQNETKLHHVYLWYTLRDFQNGPIEKQMSVPIKKSNLIIRLSFFTNAHRHTCSVHQIANFILPIVHLCHQQLLEVNTVLLWMHSVIILILHGSYTKSLHHVYLWHTLRGFQNGPIEE
jgi:hypothetical protein